MQRTSNPLCFQFGGAHITHQSHQAIRPVATCSLGERALGVDYGLRRVGLAVSVGISPRALPVLEHRNKPEAVAKEVAKAAVASICDTIVVGLPIDMMGKEGEQALATRVFLSALMSAAPWARVVAIDERLSSSEARTRLGDVSAHMRKGLVDGMAAVILLERYFGDEGEAETAVMQKGEGVVEWGGGGQPGRKGFLEWKKEAMARVKQSEAHLHHRRKKS